MKESQRLMALARRPFEAHSPKVNERQSGVNVAAFGAGMPLAIMSTATWLPALSPLTIEFWSLRLASNHLWMI
jgi:hypothetical protein